MTLFQVGRCRFNSGFSFNSHTVSLCHCHLLAAFLAKLKWLHAAYWPWGNMHASSEGYSERAITSHHNVPLHFSSKAAHQPVFQDSRFPQVGLRFQLTVSPNVRSHIGDSLSNLTEGLPGSIRGDVQAHLEVKRLTQQIHLEKVSSNNANPTPLNFHILQLVRCSKVMTPVQK